MRHRGCRLPGGWRPHPLRRDRAGDAGPYQVEAELYYQSIGHRWAENLRSYDAPEPQRFVRYYDAMAAAATVRLAAVTAVTR